MTELSKFQLSYLETGGVMLNMAIDQFELFLKSGNNLPEETKILAADAVIDLRSKFYSINKAINKTGFYNRLHFDEGDGKGQYLIHGKDNGK